jgi:hypothetical protein
MFLPEISSVASFKNPYFDDDPSKSYEARKKSVRGSLAIFMISAIAYAIFHYAPVQTFLFASLGLTCSSVAKYILPNYNLLHTVERKIFLFEKKAPYVRLIVDVVAIIFSFWLPLLACSLAFASGLTAGLFFARKIYFVQQRACCRWLS